MTFFIGLNAFTHPYHCRTYAVTMKNKQIAGVLYTLAAIELAVGVYFFVNDAANPG